MLVLRNELLRKESQLQSHATRNEQLERELAEREQRATRDY